MAGTTGYVTTLIEYYDNYTNELRHRLNDAVHGIGARNYEPKHFLSDVLYVWYRAVMGPWAPLVVARPSGPGRVVLRLHPGTDTAEFSLAVIAPGGSEPKLVADLKEQGGATIPANQVTVALVASRTTLKVQISGLNALPAAIQIGHTYRGEVQLDNEPLAYIDAPVVPAH